MSPKIGTAKVGEKKSVRDEIAAFNQKPAVDPAAVAIAKRNAAAASKPKAEKPAKPVKPAPEPEPEEVEEEEEIDEDESSEAHPLTAALDALPASERKKSGPRAAMLAAASRVERRLAWVHSVASAYACVAEAHVNGVAYDVTAASIAAAMRHLASRLPEAGEVPSLMQGSKRNGAKRIVEGSHVRIVDKARKRFTLVAKADEMDKCEVLAVAGNNLAVKFKRGGQSLVRRVDVELVTS